MAAIRPFRGLRYTQTAGGLSSLLSSPSTGMTPVGRQSYGARSPHNAVHVAQPEGHGDDRSKFVRYARSAARLAEWRREGMLAPEPQPALYRLIQRYGNPTGGDPIERIVLLAVADVSGVRPVERAEAHAKEDRLRLLEATRTSFESSVGLYEDPARETLSVVAAAPASSETAFTSEGLSGVLEAISDPEAIAAIQGAFSGKEIYVADGVEGYEAARKFRAGIGAREGRVAEDGVLLALDSMDASSSARLPVHRVLRRLPGSVDRESLLTRLASRFRIEEHHNRNLPVYLDRAHTEGNDAFGLATEGGLGYLLIPLQRVEGPSSLWLHKEILGGMFGVTDRESMLYFTDPVQASRTADEGAAAAFLLPPPRKEDVIETIRQGELLPYHAATTYPAIPTGLVYWSMGDDA